MKWLLRSNICNVHKVGNTQKINATTGRQIHMCIVIIKQPKDMSNNPIFKAAMYIMTYL